MARPSISGRDYDKIKEELKIRIAQMVPEWTDFSDANPGMAIVDAVAAVGDMNSFYTDRQFLEALLPTTTERKNFNKVASLIGYTIPLASSASMQIKIPWNKEAAKTSMPLPAYTGFTVYKKGEASDQKVIHSTYYNTEEYLLKKDEPDKIVTLREGVLSSTAISVPDAKTQEVPYEFVLEAGIDKDSIRVTVENISNSASQVWSYQDPTEFNLNSIREGETSLYFTILSDGDSYVLIMPYDWWKAGEISGESSPLYGYAEENLSVVVRYLKTSGALGNLSKEQVDSIVIGVNENVVLDFEGTLLNPVPYTSSSGGSDDLDLETAKILAPEMYKAKDNCVTLTDYITYCKNREGIINCLALDSSVSVTDDVAVGTWTRVGTSADLRIKLNEGFDLIESNEHSKTYVLRGSNSTQAELSVLNGLFEASSTSASSNSVAGAIKGVRAVSENEVYVATQTGAILWLKEAQVTLGKASGNIYQVSAIEGTQPPTDIPANEIWVTPIPDHILYTPIDQIDDGNYSKGMFKLTPELCTKDFADTIGLELSQRSAVSSTVEMKYGSELLSSRDAEPEIKTLGANEKFLFDIIDGSSIIKKGVYYPFSVKIEITKRTASARITRALQRQIYQAIQEIFPVSGEFGKDIKVIDIYNAVSPVVVAAGFLLVNVKLIPVTASIQSVFIPDPVEEEEFTDVQDVISDEDIQDMIQDIEDEAAGIAEEELTGTWQQKYVLTKGTVSSSSMFEVPEDRLPVLYSEGSEIGTPSGD